MTTDCVNNSVGVIFDSNMPSSKRRQRALKTRLIGQLRVRQRRRFCRTGIIWRAEARHSRLSPVAIKAPAPSSPASAATSPIRSMMRQHRCSANSPHCKPARNACFPAHGRHFSSYQCCSPLGAPRTKQRRRSHQPRARPVRQAVSRKRTS